MKRFIATLALCTLAFPSFAQYALQFGAAVAVSEDQVLVGEGRNLLLPGSVFVFEASADGNWILADELFPSDDKTTAFGFGRALSSSGKTLVVGAPTEQAVYVYNKDEAGKWSSSARIPGNHEGFGASVSLNGNHLIVGAAGNRRAAGAAYAFQRNDEGLWQEAGQLSIEDAAPGDQYGSKVVVQNNRALVSAPGTDSRAGAVYSFTFEAGSWQNMGALEFPALASNHGFGGALYLAGTHAAIGAPGYDNRVGTVAIFSLNEEDNSWSYDRRLAPFDARGNERFGSSLALADGMLWVGAPGYGDQEGMVYQFEIDGETHRMAGISLLAPTGLHYRSSMGTSLAANDELAILGANGHDNFEGAAFIYTKSAGSWSPAGSVYNDATEFATVNGDMLKCEDGMAGAFTCDSIDMVSFMSRHDAGAKRGIQVNDVWGWEDPLTGREYALVGRTDGTSFIDLTDPSYPVYLGNLPLTPGAHQSIWRDVKVYKNHAFVVSDGAGPHHMQVFDLTRLRNIDNPPVEFEVTALYKGIYSSHNIIVNEDTGFAYAVGSDSGGETCGGALHMINIQDPTNPTFAGCFADTRTGRSGSGSTHDAQCVIYQGPDANYQGHEICLSSNGTALSIADVTDKDNPIAISIAEYPKVAYTHQGWLTDDHRYFYLNDEGDEVSDLVEATRTMIFDITELDDPVAVGEYYGPDNAIDHNLYIRGDLMYQTNYVSGLRIIDISDRENPIEIGHFDTVPYGKNDNSPVLGAWSNYPYFKSGVIVVTSGREGVFFLKKKDVDI